MSRHHYDDIIRVDRSVTVTSAGATDAPSSARILFRFLISQRRILSTTT